MASDWCTPPEIIAVLGWVWPIASSVFFFRGRLHFYTPGGIRAKGNAGAPSMLISYDKSNIAINA